MITENQRKNLIIIAGKVMRKDMPKMQIHELINRICFITGKDISKCIEGYRIMREEKIIPDEYLVENRSDEKRIMTSLTKNPNLSELLDKFGCTLGPFKAPPIPEVLEYPEPFKAENFAKSLNLQSDF